jgi:hypothetical protein
MNKETVEIISAIETYLKGIAEEKIRPEEIGINITNLLIKQGFVNESFSIEAIPIFDSYVLRSRNLYTTNKIGAMPSFCKICGKLLGKSPCQHKQ